MKRHFFGAVGSLTALLLVAGCATDPTGDLRGDVASVVISRNYVELNVGETIRLNAKAYDSQGNALAMLPTISVDDETVATITLDTITSGNPLPETDFVVTAVSAGRVTVTATAGSVTGTSDVISFPTAFTGAVSVAASGNGYDIVTVAATNNIKFDPAATTATIGGVDAFVHSITADQLQLVSSGADGATGATLNVTNLVFLGDIAVSSLDATTPVTVAAFQNIMTDDPATAPNITSSIPFTYYALVTPSVPDIFARIAPTADLAVNTTVTWLTGDDVDILWCDDVCAAYTGNFDGATGANPEQSNVTVPAGVAWNFWLELYDGDGSIVQVKMEQP